MHPTLKKLPKQLGIIFVHWWSHKSVISLWKDLRVSLSTFKYSRKKRTLGRHLPRAVSPSGTLPSVCQVLLSICLLALASVCVQMTEDLNTILRQRSWSKIHCYQEYSATKSQDKLLNHFLITSYAGISCDGKWLITDLPISVFVSGLQLQMPSLSVAPFLAGSCRNILRSKIKTSSSSQNQRNPRQTFLSML